MSKGKTCKALCHILHSLLTLLALQISSHGIALVRRLFFKKSFQELFCFLAVELTKQFLALAEVEESVTLGGNYASVLDTDIEKGYILTPIRNSKCIAIRRTNQELHLGSIGTWPDLEE